MSRRSCRDSSTRACWARGGFADVFLYDQQLPRRQVAVKVLVADANDERIRSSFRREANLMAQLSAHPAIVTIHAAAVSDDGRPFIVMGVLSQAQPRRAVQA